jgi:hypothetical protein
VAQRRLLLRWRAQGLTLAQIGLRLRVSKQAISQQLRQILASQARGGGEFEKTVRERGRARPA